MLSGVAPKVSAEAIVAEVPKPLAVEVPILVTVVPFTQ